MLQAVALRRQIDTSIALCLAGSAWQECDESLMTDSSHINTRWPVDTEGLGYRSELDRFRTDRDKVKIGIKLD